MKRYDITLVSIGIIWLWVIIASSAVLKGAYPSLEIGILEADGALACLLTLWLKRPVTIKTTVVEPSAKPSSSRVE